MQKLLLTDSHWPQYHLPLCTKNEDVVPVAGTPTPDNSPQALSHVRISSRRAWQGQADRRGEVPDREKRRQIQKTEASVINFFATISFGPRVPELPFWNKASAHIAQLSERWPLGRMMVGSSPSRYFYGLGLDVS